MLDRLKNFGWLASEELVRLAVGFLVAILLARYLGVAEFGAYAYVFALVGLFIPVAAFGLDPLITRQIIADPASTGAILGTATVIRMGATALSLAAAFCSVLWLPGPPGTSLYLFLLAGVAVLSLPFQTTNVYFKALEQPKLATRPRMIIFVAAGAVMIVLLARRASLENFVELRALEALLLGAAAIVVFVTQRAKRIRFEFDRRLFRQFLRDGLPLMISGVAGIVYMRIDQIMLGQLAPVEQLGQYAVAVRFSDSALFVPMALHAAFFPALVRSGQAGSTAYDAERQRYFDVMSATMLLTAIGVGLVSVLAIATVLGEVYRASIPMMAVLLLGLPFIGLGVARSAHLTIKNLLWIAPQTTALGAVMNIGLNFLLIPRMGGVGAAIASVVSYWFAAHGSCYLFPVLRPVASDLTRALSPVGIAHRLMHKDHPAPESGAQL